LAALALLLLPFVLHLPNFKSLGQDPLVFMKLKCEQSVVMTTIISIKAGVEQCHLLMF
jgi:hypothetical protein